MFWAPAVRTGAGARLASAVLYRVLGAFVICTFGILVGVLVLVGRSRVLGLIVRGLIAGFGVLAVLAVVAAIFHCGMLLSILSTAGGPTV